MQPTNIIPISQHLDPEPEEEVKKSDPRRNWGSVSPITESNEAHLEITSKEGIVKIEITDEAELERRRKLMDEYDNRSEAEKNEIMGAL